MKIGGFMYWEQAYYCCQEAIKQEATTPPTPPASTAGGELIASLGEGRIKDKEGIYSRKVSH